MDFLFLQQPKLVCSHLDYHLEIWAQEDSTDYLENFLALASELHQQLLKALLKDSWVSLHQ